MDTTIPSKRDMKRYTAGFETDFGKMNCNTNGLKDLAIVRQASGPSCTASMAEMLKFPELGYNLTPDRDAK